MPDLTIENYWACEANVEYVTTPPRLRKIIKLEKPRCTWNAYVHGGHPVETKCPHCGGNVTVVKYAV